MKFGPVPLPRAKEKILGRNIAAADGQRLLRKGKPLTGDDLESLRLLGRDSVANIGRRPSGGSHARYPA